jgi:hypothetical protein
MANPWKQVKIISKVYLDYKIKAIVYRDNGLLKIYL